MSKNTDNGLLWALGTAGALALGSMVVARASGSRSSHSCSSCGSANCATEKEDEARGSYLLRQRFGARAGFVVPLSRIYGYCGRANERGKAFLAFYQNEARQILRNGDRKRFEALDAYQQRARQRLATRVRHLRQRQADVAQRGAARQALCQGPHAHVAHGVAIEPQAPEVWHARERLCQGAHALIRDLGAMQVQLLHALWQSLEHCSQALVPNLIGAQSEGLQATDLVLGQALCQVDALLRIQLVVAQVQRPQVGQPRQHRVHGV